LSCWRRSGCFRPRTGVICLGRVSTGLVARSVGCRRVAEGLPERPLTAGFPGTCGTLASRRGLY
jgi:hypothetical protein